MHYVNTLLALIAHHPGPAYGAVFLVSLFESLALVGLIVPGTTIMFGVGAIVATGSLGLAPVLLLAAAGAIAGDGISYWLGRRYQEELRRRWPFRRLPGLLKNGEIFFSRHGGKSILFGRFVGPIRPVIPVVAGMLGMPPAPFIVVNVLSAVGWALAYTLPGLLFGSSLAVAGAVSKRLAVLLFLILASVWGFIWFIRKLVRWVTDRGPIWIAGLKNRLAADSAVHGAILPVRRFFFHLIGRPHGEEVLLCALVLAFFMAAWGFLGILQAVLAKDPLVLADQSVYHFFQSLRTPWADHIFVSITELGDSSVNIGLAGMVLLLLLGKRCYSTAGFWVLTVLGGLAGVQLLKWTIHLPRPVTLYQGASAYGFPSAHTTMSVILYGFLSIMLVRGLGGNRRWGLVVAALMASFIIAISRLYLGAHWLSDVLGGFFIGTSWTALLGIAYLKSSAEGVPRRLLWLLTIGMIMIGGGWHVTQRHAKDMMVYAPQQDVQSMPLETWLAGGWRDPPAWRIDMEGEQEQPLNIQWAGKPAELAQYLATRGWHRPPPLSLKIFLGMLSPDTSIEQLPVLPRLHSGRADRLCLTRAVGDRRMVLWLWPSDVDISGGHTSLFVGTLEIQRRRQLTWLITAAGDMGEYGRQQDVVLQWLGDRFNVKSVDRSAETIQVNGGNNRLHWDGRVFLIWNKAT